ncbi:MAG: trigger factor [Bacilli bacterium]|nr:trigger factor [Bacilli bacterium]
MERKVTKLENCHTEVVVNVDKDLWKKAQDKAFRKLAANVTIPGFRKGKAPVNMVKGHVDQMKVFNEAINGVIPEVYQDVVENEKLEPMVRPNVDVTKLSEEELELKLVIVTRPNVELGKYQGYEIGKKEVEVSDEEIDNAINELRKQNATISPKEGQAENGDIVVIDFEGSVDGVPFDGGKAENHELELGSHSFIQGFEEQLVGSSAGIEVDVKVTFPKNYGPDEIAGKDAVFHVKVNEVKQKVLPELDEEFIKDLNIPNVETIDALRKDRADNLLKQKEGAAKREYLDKLYEEIKKVSKFEIADEIVNEEFENRKKDLQNRLAQSGIDLEQYLALTRTSEEDLNKQLREEAVKGLQTFLVTEEVGLKEKISVSDEEFEFELAKMGEQYNMSVDQIKEALGKQLGQFRNNIRMSRIEDFLYNNNK